jgi:threonine dehydrogenase-like Zn-dependent dehydrogenase
LEAYQAETEALACAYHAVAKNNSKGYYFGIRIYRLIGLLVAQLAKNYGARVLITD